MAFIAFLGPDGCGKSTILREVGTYFKNAGTAVVYYHWRPDPFRKNRGNQTAPDPHGKPPRSCITSCIKLFWIVANWQIGWWTGLRRASRRGLVLFDRCYTDILIDPARYRYGGPVGLARLMEFFVPRPDLVFLLDADAALLLARKQELSFPILKQLRHTYLACANKRSNFYILDASKPVGEMLLEVRHKLDQLKCDG